MALPDRQPTLHTERYPPSGSPFAAANVANVTFTTDTTETITLTPPLTLGGQVTGGLGQPLPNQTVRLHPAGGGAGLSTTTDGNGQYSFQTGAGSYSLEIDNGTPPTTVNTPEFYNFFSKTFFLTQSTVLNIPLPFKQVSVHVQDPAGNPLANIGVGTSDNYENPLTAGSLSGLGSSYYNPGATATDAAGNVTLWLFPTANQPYTLSAIPTVRQPVCAL